MQFFFLLLVYRETDLASQKASYERSNHLTLAIRTKSAMADAT